MKHRCGVFIAVKCVQCGCTHVYKRFCKTAGCEEPGCAEARQRLHVRKLLAVQFDYKKQFVFLTLTSRNVSKQDVDSKTFRQSRILAVKSVMDSLQVKNWVVAHEITVKPLARCRDLFEIVAGRFHYHHHIVFQYEYSSDIDLTERIRDVWESAIQECVEDGHGVNVLETTSEDHEKLAKYLCKYLSKGQIDDKSTYYPKGMQSFQRHGQFDTREYEYEFEQHAMCKAGMIQSFNSIHVDQTLTSNAVDGTAMMFSVQPAHTPTEISTDKVLGGYITHVKLHRNEQLMISAVRSLTIRVDRKGSQSVLKDCVNCRTRFKEDVYNRDLLFSLFDASEREQFVKKHRLAHVGQRIQRQMLDDQHSSVLDALPLHPFAMSYKERALLSKKLSKYDRRLVSLNSDIRSP